MAHNYTIMATLGKSEKILDAIASFTNQDYQNKTLVVIDDSGVCKVSDYVDSENIVVIHNDKNRGFARSLNIALDHIMKNTELSSRDTISILDDDDEWKIITKLSQQINFLEENLEIDLCSTNASVVKRGKIFGVIPKFQGLVTGEVICKFNPIVHSSVTFKARLILDGTYSYNDSFIRSCDWELWLRLILEHDKKLYVMSEKMVNYTVGSSLLQRIKKRGTDLTYNKILKRRHPQVSVETSWIQYIWSRLT